MELDITQLVQEISPSNYSASRAELGQGAGAITWGHACEDALELFGDQFEREEFDAHFKPYGAWDDEELAAHSDEECAALMLQFIAADMRECDFQAFADMPDAPEQFTPEWWTLYETDPCGNSGAFGRGDDGRIFYTIGA